MTQALDNDLLEPILDGSDIQGNIVPGFNKDHRTLLGFTIGNPDESKKWIKLISDQISTFYEVYSFSNAYKSEMQRLRTEPMGLIATWTNIAFSYPGMKKLLKDMRQVDPFLDNAFKNGLHLSSSSLGDPADQDAEGHVSKWIIGRADDIPDIFLIVDSDLPENMEIKAHYIAETASKHGLKKIYEEIAHDLSYYGNEQLRGHEHFGFKDGISQPGIRGRISNNPTDYLTPRSTTTVNDSNSPEFSPDGKPLIAPGEFIIGYPVQNFNYPRRANPADPCPELLKNGSYLVYRRLRQDVAGFENFAKRESQKLSNSHEFSNINPTRFKSLIVGRWPSGAPLSKSPEQDNPELAKDKHNNNMFGYIDDFSGFKTPVFSHIRKINPRDLSTDDGSASKTLKRKIIRRGIPFGPPLDLAKPDPVNGNRGLLFISYQASIRDQFEFLMRKWANSAFNPSNGFSPGVHHQGGLDLVIGQGKENDNRIRHNYLRAKINDKIIEAKITTEGLGLLDWVIPTGGGYFFSPSVSSLRNILGSP